MSKFINRDEYLLLESLCHIFVLKEIIEKTSSYSEYMDNYYLVDSSLFHLSQIGEISSKFTDKFKEKYSEIKPTAIL